LPRTAKDVKPRAAPRRGLSYDTLVTLANDLTSDVSSLMNEREQLLPENAKLKEREVFLTNAVARLEKHVKNLQETLEQERKDNNTLRDRLMEATLQAEWLRGWAGGQEDAKPPQMVPAPRDRAIDRPMISPSPMNFEEMSRGYGQPIPERREWWHR
jgi:hypothetical protein